MAFDFFLADTLQRWGFWDFILPFILVFTVVFAILEKINLLGSEDEEGSGKRYHIAVALVMGLSVVIPHVLGLYPPGKDIVDIFNQSIPQVMMIIIAIVMALLMLGLFAGRGLNLNMGSSIVGWIAIAAFGIVIYIFGSAAGWWYVPYFLLSQDLQALIITILVFAIIVWFITHEKKPDGGETTGQKWADAFYGGDK